MMQQTFVFLPRSGKYQWTENNTKSFSTILKLYQRIYPADALDFMPISWNMQWMSYLAFEIFAN